jgi:flagellar basal body-associated protein FliL
MDTVSIVLIVVIVLALGAAGWVFITGKKPADLMFWKKKPEEKKEAGK